MPRAVLLTPPTTTAKEVSVLTAIAATGLPVLHVRKPGWDRAQLAAYVESLPPAVRRAAVLHDWHDLAAELGCKGVHYTERLRRAGPVRPPPGLTVSVSLHTLADVPPPGPCPFDYAFLSPVFDSVSKPGYAAAFDTADLRAALAGARTCELLALGGVTPATVHAALGLGFDGVAVLGGVWEAPDPVVAWREVLAAVA